MKILFPFSTYTHSDLLKWCHRISNVETTPENVFAAAVDCFCASLTCLPARIDRATSIGAKINISPAAAEYRFTGYRPEIATGLGSFQAGGVKLQKIVNENSSG